MINYNHHYFTNPKYVMNHICFKRTDKWEIHERQSYDTGNKKPVSLNPEQLGTPLCVGITVESAICSAVELGIKHYDIEVLSNE